MNAKNDTAVGTQHLPEWLSLPREWPGRVAWVIALLLTLGDYTVTLWAIQQPGIEEAVPISRWALDVAGPLGLLVKDALLTLLLYTGYRVLPVGYRLSVPLGIAGGRGALVLSNLAVLGWI